MAVRLIRISLCLLVGSSLVKANAESYPKQPRGSLPLSSEKQQNSLSQSTEHRAGVTAGMAYRLGAALSWSALSDDARLQLRLAASRPVAQTKSVVVVGGKYDEAEHVLSALELPFVKVAAKKIAEHLDSPCDQVVILNSGARLGAAQRKALRRFTRRGGVVLASDMAGPKILRSTFPGRKLQFRRFTALDRRGPVRVEATRATSDHGQIRNRSCASARTIAQPFQRVLLHGFVPNWRLDASSRALRIAHSSAAAAVHSLTRSDDLRPPYDSVVSCFDHKHGSVFHVAGRLFQLTLRDELNTQNAHTSRVNETELRALFTEADRGAPLQKSVQTDLLRFPPSFNQVTSSRLSTGLMLRFLEWRWKRTCHRSA